ncbi:MAG: hypothetical protein ACR2IH_12915 [Pyrinomonadaceae bacterium]
MNTFELGRSVLLTVFTTAAFGLGVACTPTPVPNKPLATPSPMASVSPSPAVSPAPGNLAGADKLAGKWLGPEGTYLSITEKPASNKDASKKYAVEIKNLDKAETFEGSANGDVIEFTRKGKTETVKAATGVETGMKGFEKETNCVLVTKGSEGFCKNQ